MYEDACAFAGQRMFEAKAAEDNGDLYVTRMLMWEVVGMCELISRIYNVGEGAVLSDVSGHFWKLKKGVQND